jgi:hypothetical protein
MGKEEYLRVNRRANCVDKRVAEAEASCYGVNLAVVRLRGGGAFFWFFGFLGFFGSGSIKLIHYLTHYRFFSSFCFFPQAVRPCPFKAVSFS